VTLRRATSEDAAAMAVIHRQAMRVSLSFLPELHTAEEDLWFMGERLLKEFEVWVAEEASEAVAYVAFSPDWVQHLYVHPDHQGRGIGPALLEIALADGHEKRLWTFQQNHRARKFYEDRGFQIETLTDGQGTEEKTPDVLYVRPGQTG
jgi:GNAT superfamily N-acetyltransferase